ncbi:hypothetical protein BGHDH14_bgh03879 [Blumeria hordei DH14]|uniref:Large ribosomal subunit protein mL50 n=1 Tax=Blumeria graminis f. sp. hordei (strain DH14) TaxID=546991 RepID=N1JHA9_BLUG1|nr:hypothetical protein BGHDH14_bgh03879 [Blumeria hordei DH14]
MSKKVMMRFIAPTVRSSALLKSNCIYEHHLCAICISQTKLYSSSSRREVDTSLPFTEKLRRKIWGTNEPPGNLNPYGKQNHIDQSDQLETNPTKLEREMSRAVETDQTDFEPATTWDGLELIGDEKDVVSRKEWLPGNNFKASFLPKHVMIDRDEITATLHRAIVEVMTWKQSGRNISEITTSTPGPDLTTKVQIINSAPDTALQFPDETCRENIIQSLTHVEDDSKATSPHSTSSDEVMSPEDNAETQESEFANQSSQNLLMSREKNIPVIYQLKTVQKSNMSSTYAELISTWDPTWTKTSLRDPAIKFAVIKRMMQLSGIRIPDNVITSAETIRALLNHIVKPPKSHKLLETLSQNEELLGLPNVSVFPRRITLCDKEKAVGRWKLIESEFEARGLTPISATRR